MLSTPKVIKYDMIIRGDKNEDKITRQQTSIGYTAKLSFAISGSQGISSVSYTHLDVYKRQLQNR